MKPFIQTKLFGLDKYFNEIANIYQNKNLPNKIILSGSKGLGKCTLAYHIINYIFSQKRNSISNG